VFFNRRCDCIKVLAWDRDGLAIWYKRLESGTFELTPLASEGTSLEIDHVKLSMLLSGIDLASAKRRKRYKIA
jgi:transposase